MENYCFSFGVGPVASKMFVFEKLHFLDVFLFGHDLFFILVTCLPNLIYSIAEAMQKDLALDGPSQTNTKKVPKK